ncbi:hypothetical protein Tco_0269353 [Tanacetum coccineum]
MTTPVKKRNNNKFCEFHEKVGHNTDECMHLRRQIEELIKAEKLSHVIKELEQGSGKDQPKTTKKGETSGKDKPLAILMVQPCQRDARQRITQGFSPNPKISFPPLGDEDGTEGPMIIEAEIGATTPLIGFSKEIIWPMRQILLPVKIGDAENSTSTWIDFVVSSRIIPLECTMVSGPEAQPSCITQVAEERIRVEVYLKYPEQTIAIGSTLTEEGYKALASLECSRRMPSSQTKEKKPITRKEQGTTRGSSKTYKRRNNYHSWLSNPIMVKKHDDSWRMCVDFKDLNKACPKGGYPLLEIDWKVESLYGYPFKYFQNEYKGYHQIKMAKENVEKMAFITSQGIFCYSKMPFGLKNAGATY